MAFQCLPVSESRHDPLVAPARVSALVTDPALGKQDSQKPKLNPVISGSPGTAPLWVASSHWSSTCSSNHSPSGPYLRTFTLNFRV